MERLGHENVQWFIGTEVEHTPAFGKKTLFVVGIQDVLVLKKHTKNKSVNIYSLVLIIRTIQKTMMNVMSGRL